MKHRNWLTQRIIIFLAMLSAFVVSAQQLNVGYIDRPPAIFETASGELRGEMGMKVRSILAESNVSSRLTSFKIEELDRFLKGDGVDAILATRILAQKDGLFLFSAKPIYILQFYAYRMPSTKKVSSLNDLKDKLVITAIPPNWMRGSGLGNLINDASNNVTPVAVERNLDRAFRYLRKSDADYFVSYIAPKSYEFNFSNVIRNKQVEVDALFEEPMYLLIKKTHPDAQTLMTQIDQVL